MAIMGVACCSSVRHGKMLGFASFQGTLAPQERRIPCTIARVERPPDWPSCACSCARWRNACTGSHDANELLHELAGYLSGTTTRQIGGNWDLLCSLGTSVIMFDFRASACFIYCFIAAREEKYSCELAFGGFVPLMPFKYPRPMCTNRAHKQGSCARRFKPYR